MATLTAEYNLLYKQLEALLAGERHWLTNLSQFNALLFNGISDINWAGAYWLYDAENLQLGPYQGQVACTQIKVGKGVCGTSVKQASSILVKDVDQFVGHIACDSRSRSELVVPITVNGRIWGVYDLDSPSLARFSKQDQLGIEALVALLVKSSDWPPQI